METLKKILIVVVLMAGLGTLIYMGNVFSEKDPAYLPYPGTYYGCPAFIQLHRYNERGDGLQWFTFYRAENFRNYKGGFKDEGKWIIGPEICTVTTELALHMYHEVPGYPK